MPLPASISPEARAFISRPARPAVYPPLDDREAWRGLVERANAEALASMAKVESWAAKVEHRQIAGVSVYVATPPQLKTTAVAVYLHSGGMVLMGGDVVRLSTKIEATRLGCVVFGVDFRTAPLPGGAGGLRQRLRGRYLDSNNRQCVRVINVFRRN